MIKIQLCGVEDPQPPNMDILKSSLPLVVKYTELRRVGCLIYGFLNFTTAHGQKTVVNE